MASAAEIAAWARGVGFAGPLGSCVGRLYAGQHGGSLPASRGELCDWANSTGVRTADGEWHCQSQEDSAVSYQHWWEDTTATTARIRAWIYQNPLGALGIAAGLWVVLGFSGDRKRKPWR